MSHEAAQRINEWFKSGKLVRPSADQLNFLDFTWALAGLAGVPNARSSSGVSRVRDLIGLPKHIIFILIDGMGLNLLQSLPPKTFLRKKQVEELQSVFLSTTATALTSLATGEWPATHSLPGWWTRLDPPGISSLPIRFVERDSENSLSDFGVKPEDVYVVPSVWGQAERQLQSYFPAEIIGSQYSLFTSGNTPCKGYKEVPLVLEEMRMDLSQRKDPSLAYLYLPHVDSLSHEHGVQNAHVHDFLKDLDRDLERFARSLPGNTRLIVTADHGQANVLLENRIVLDADDPLRRFLACQPTGEPTVPIFHTVPGMEDEFEKAFTERFEEQFVLLTPSEVEDLRLLGPETLRPAMRKRLGSFVGISPMPSKFYIHPCEKASPQKIGVHGGMTSEEMQVPLIVA